MINLSKLIEDNLKTDEHNSAAAAEYLEKTAGVEITSVRPFNFYKNYFTAIAEDINNNIYIMFFELSGALTIIREKSEDGKILYFTEE